MNANFQRRDAETRRREETHLSLAPGFSRVISAGGMKKPFQRFLRADSKPLKRFARCAVANTRLKPGANENGIGDASFSIILSLITTIAVMLTTIGAYAQGSLTLNAGDVYTYEFSTLPLIGTWSVLDPPGVPGGRVTGLFVLGSFVPGSTIRVEMFEDSVNTPAVASQTLVSIGGPAVPPGPWFSSAGSWQDLQGAVRVSMLTGSVIMYQFQVTANRNDSGVLNSYGASALPVPEPNSILLIGLVALFGTLRKSRCHLAPLRQKE